MKPRMNVALLATLVAATGWSQDVSVYSTTIAQMWKQETPGFDKSTFTPATQFLGIDATKLGDDALSLHLFGWGQVDLSDATAPGGKSRGDFSVGYLQYRFSQANAEIKAGRFSVFQGVGVEQVDGVSARADLKGGFAVSGFFGRPVLFKTVDAVSQKDYDYQNDFIFGTRLSMRLPQLGEIGLSYLQDGTKAPQNLRLPSVADFTRKQVGLDLLISPVSTVDFSGRTVMDVASHPDTSESPSRIAEHDYSLNLKLPATFAVSTSFTQRNYFAYFAGSNLPSLFKQDEHDKFQAWGGKVSWGAPSSLLVSADYKHTDRETYGTVNRYGGEVRWTIEGLKLQTGASAHMANAAKALEVDALSPERSLSYAEGRAWVMYQDGKLSGSLDGILLRFRSINPYTYGSRYDGELVGSVGYQLTSNLKVSGDLGVGRTPLAKKDVKALLRAEYHFGFARKGGH